MKILVIIPAYNEEDSIEEVVNKLKITQSEVDYIIINDCSTDNTVKICKNNSFNYINLPVNLGIGGGVQTGYRYAVENDYDIAIQMDGDGQHDPEGIDRLIKPIIEDGFDLVIGSRFITNDGFQSSVMRRTGIRFLKWLIKICCGVKINDTTSGFRASSKELTKHFSLEYAQDYPEPEAIIAAVLNGYRVCEVPVIMHERQGGESSINAFKSIYYMAKVSLAIFIYRIGSFKNVRERKL
ncbi:glycosyltransferase [Acetobacterium fimetarium]|uniref:Glycosyltransferase n=1 Tax=Acetobacterium fimetarium TaxID=52691 RepID=A0ABR6WW68_9FIRM|nr:glycosyltransferase family 2 protein [Acetobacterium fimetarium]MBC3804481.1 glycosyltransferase [Acetobacterium fimetarium]